MAEEFQNVVGKKGRRKNKKAVRTTPENIVNEIRSELESTQFFKESCDVIGSQPGAGLVCYGLGNFAESYIARYQLAFLLALRDQIQIPYEKCEIYDPQFTETEVSALKKMEFCVLEENQEGKRPCEHKTIFYMPHCGKALYNNLLWANWGPQLSNLVVIGNSFSRMIDSTPSRILQKTASYVIKIHPYTYESPLSVPQQYEDVFNDTSIHTFLVKSEQEVPRELWEDKEEPQYDSDDAEIIFS